MIHNNFRALKQQATFVNAQMVDLEMGSRQNLAVMVVLKLVRCLNWTAQTIISRLTSIQD